MNLDEIQTIFFQECEEGLIQAEQGLMALQAGATDEETINTIFRAVHSIKGGAGAFGHTDLQTFTHHFETVLDQVRSGERTVAADLTGVMLAAFDTLTDHVNAIRGDGNPPDDARILAQLEAFAASAAAPEEAAAALPAPANDKFGALGFDLDAMLGSLEDSAPPVESWEKDDGDIAPVPAPLASTRLLVKPLAGALSNGGDPLLLLRELIALGATLRNADWSAVPVIDAFDPAQSYLSWHLEIPASLSRSAIDEIFEFVSDSCELRFEGDSPTPEPEPRAPSEPEPETELSIDALLAGALDDLSDTAVPEIPAIEIMESEPTPLPVAAAATAPEPEKLAPVVEKAAAAPPAPAVTATIRVDLEKLDRLVDLVGELVITQSMLAQRLSDNDLTQFDELANLEHLTRDLQDSAMSIRAQPIQSVFGRVPRIIRELQASTAKKVRLEVEGEATELDKTVVERIGDPLTHLIRNAVDHGLESPEDRIAAGKPAEGHIRLAAEHRSGRILISVSDDGRGINRERVFAKAVERNLIPADAKLSHEEIDNLIFAPGFSTAETVSNISGRGVGMDVVRRNIAALGGRITILSRPGEGSTFTMSLPLTLAILDGMIVTVGEQSFVVPLNQIVETIRPKPDLVRDIGGGQAMLNVRDQWLPVISIGRRMTIAGSCARPTDAVILIVETEAAGLAVLMVDRIVDQRQVVIKNLEANYRQVDDVAGATILGNGQVALILDVEAIAASPGGVAGQSIAA